MNQEKHKKQKIKLPNQKIIDYSGSNRWGHSLSKDGMTICGDRIEKYDYILIGMESGKKAAYQVLEFKKFLDPKDLFKLEVLAPVCYIESEEHSNINYLNSFEVKKGFNDNATDGTLINLIGEIVSNSFGIREYKLKTRINKGKTWQWRGLLK